MGGSSPLSDVQKPIFNADAEIYNLSLIGCLCLGMYYLDTCVYV
jgi:hypothetical protein